MADVRITKTIVIGNLCAHWPVKPRFSSVAATAASHTWQVRVWKIRHRRFTLFLIC